MLFENESFRNKSYSYRWVVWLVWSSAQNFTNSNTSFYEIWTWFQFCMKIMACIAHIMCRGCFQQKKKFDSLCRWPKGRTCFLIKVELWFCNVAAKVYAIHIVKICCSKQLWLNLVRSHTQLYSYAGWKWHP